MIDIQSYLCVFVMILGAILYLLIDPSTPTKAKLSEMARLMFACGLLVTLLQFMTHVIKL